MNGRAFAHAAGCPGSCLQAGDENVEEERIRYCWGLTGVSQINSAVAQLDTITQQTAALAEAQQHAEINHRSEAD